MDKRVILAVAGAGKTTEIINLLQENSRALVVTYTQNNYNNLREAVLRKFGYIPGKIRLFTYFSFLYSFCFRPLLLDELDVKGISFDRPPVRTFFHNDIERYIDPHRRLYFNRLAKLLEARGLIPDIRRRLEKYFDWLLVDEVQDFAGHDFNFLMAISNAELQHVYVGDFYQHTFDTSSDGNVNRGLYNELERYVERLYASGFDVNRTALKKSRRCSPTVCKFVSDYLGIEMESHRNDETLVHWIENEDQMWEIYSCNSVVKLFYQQHHKYACRSNNWALSKGDTYDNVCVVLNKTTYDLLSRGNYKHLNPRTRNKLYVACTRTKNALYLAPQSMLEKVLGRRSSQVAGG